jgi:hypothetical protein
MGPDGCCRVLWLCRHPPSLEIALVALLPVVVFWLLDTYYLRQERLFRCLYEDARQAITTVPLFSMNTDPYKSPKAKSLCVAKSMTLWLFYGLLFVVGLALLAASIHHDLNPEHAARTRSAISSVTSSIHGSAGGQMFPM